MFNSVGYDGGGVVWYMVSFWYGAIRRCCMGMAVLARVLMVVMLLVFFFF